MKLIFSCSILLSVIISQAQNNKAQSVSAESGKNGLIISIIYDHQFSKSHLGLGTGAGSNFAKYFKRSVFRAGLSPGFTKHGFLQELTSLLDINGKISNDLHHIQEKFVENRNAV